jgi:hypothetical protein
LDPFEKDAAEMIDGGIIAAWVRFRAAVSELLDKYHETPRGHQFPAVLTAESDTLLAVNCGKALHMDGMASSQVMATARMKVINRQATIDCLVSHWLKRAGGSIAPKVETEKSYVFALMSDMKSLKYRTEELSPYDAASKVLEATLLKDR